MVWIRAVEDFRLGEVWRLHDSAGGIFVSDAKVVAAGTGSMTYVDDFATYVTAPLLARTPHFVRSTGGNFGLVEGSLVRELGGGLRTGPQAPGFNPAGLDWMMRQLGIDRGRRTSLLKSPRRWRR